MNNCKSQSTVDRRETKASLCRRRVSAFIVVPHVTLSGFSLFFLQRSLFSFHSGGGTLAMTLPRANSILVHSGSLQKKEEIQMKQRVKRNAKNREK